MLQTLKSPTTYPKAFYFLFFAATAALVPFLALFYQDLGLSGRQIGLLTGIMPLTTWAGAWLWSGLADALQRHHRVLLLAIAGAWFFALILSWVERFALLIPAVILYSFFIAPIVPLIDNALLRLLGSRKAEYGRSRLWGAVGWGLAAPLVGILIERTNQAWAFYWFLAVTLLLFALSTRFPFERAKLSGPFGQGLRRLLSNWQLLLFLFVALLEGMGLSIILNFLFLYMGELGASEMLMGLSLTVGTISEIRVWQLAGHWLKRWGPRSLIVVSLVALSARSLAYSFIEAAWLVLPISLLHGFSFATLWSAGVAYADEVAPPGLEATAQGLFSGTVMGLGAALGAFLGGFLYDEVGPIQMFRIVALALIAVLFLYLAAGNDKRRLP